MVSDTSYLGVYRVASTLSCFFVHRLLSVNV
jgi:hypothetical protein